MGPILPGPGAPPGHGPTVCAMTTQDEPTQPFSVDTDGDGRADMWGHDTDGDGKLDRFEVDTDGDGSPDVGTAS